MVGDMIQTLNEMYEPRSADGVSNKNQWAPAHDEQSVSRLRAAVGEMGEPPAELTGGQALAELAATRSYEDERADLAQPPEREREQE